MPQPLRSLIFNTGAYIDTPANYLSPIFNILLPKNVPSRDRPESSNNQKDIYALWLASRCTAHESITPLPPGGQRAFTSRNVALACEVSKRCALDILGRLWQMHPYRISLMAGFDLLRGAFPALRGYSHALIIDEVQRSVLSGNLTVAPLIRPALMELLRMIFETAMDSIATSNENKIQASARFLVEHAQLEYRLRADVPTLSDPSVRDLMQEADIFVRSFNGFSPFGLFSPLDFMRIVTLFSELLTHLWVLSTLTFGTTPFPVILLSVALSALPSMLTWSAGSPKSWDTRTTRLEARLAAKQEAMRHLAHSDSYRPEVMLFDLGPWILRTWAQARKAMLGLERRHEGSDRDIASKLLSQLYLSGAFSAFEHIPVLLVLNSSTSSLGAFSLYRSTLQSLFLTAGTMVQTLRLAFQGIFLMGAFCAATKLTPRLEPPAERTIAYQHTGNGAAIDIRNISFTYPGSKTPSLRRVSLSIGAGETVAIVGCNGSGKTTLAKVLLRIFDFDDGQLLVNGTDVRRFQPQDFHAHVTAVFQGFSRFSTNVKGNVGVGYVPEMNSAESVQAALDLAGADDLVRSLPEGLKTTLDGDGSYHIACEGFASGGSSSRKPHGLSGGEWQRIAISRAFMRARRPEVELLVFDEPTSSLDAHAQKQFFDAVEQVSRAADGTRTKTVIFITHRLSTARRADKIAMMENGEITEFGTHQELIARKGRYAAMYDASI
ncbi:P-loop containing nucleoside triphosphate hydrolase protein [Cubamyces menziesii]|nr:P-loop containing nucleoside triphosphate hydrolase protein [Cubamyces menziesii]